ncbi:MAG: glutamate racemase [Treponema sp.]
MVKMVDFVFLDSGTGGIPYLAHLLKKRPLVSSVYIADTKNFPYGEKSHEEIVKCVLEIVKKIIEKFEPRIFVVACNTMSVNALNVLREVFPDTQFVGTVPAIKLAASISRKKKIGLLATRSTVENPYNVDLKNHFASDCELVFRADPELISFIEKKSFTASEDECMKAVLPAADFFKEKGCDVIILGCTHFLNLSDVIQKAAGESVKVVDSREGVVNRALNILDTCFSSSDKNSESQNSCGQKKSHLFITGFSSEKDKNEYDVICSKYNLEWGGIL